MNGCYVEGFTGCLGVLSILGIFGFLIWAFLDSFINRRLSDCCSTFITELKIEKAISEHETTKHKKKSHSKDS